MSGGSPSGLPDLLTGRQHGQALQLSLLMLASALTEGLGLALLVPLLALLLPAGGVAGPDWLAGFMPTWLGLEGLLAGFVGLVLLRAVIALLRTRAALELELAVVNGLRQRTWRALLHADWRFLSGLRRSQQASLLISNLDRVGFGLNQALAGFSAAVTLLALGLAALAISPLLALAAGAGCALVLLAYAGLRQRAASEGAALGRAWDQVHAALHDGLAALRLTKASGAEAQMERDAAEAFSGLAAARRSFVSNASLGALVLHGGGAVVLAVLVWLAISRWAVPLVSLLPMAALFARAVPLLGAVQEAWQQWHHARPALAESRALIVSAEAACEPPVRADAAPQLAQAITLAGAVVHYAGQPAAAVDAVSLVVPAGKITALVGPSGAGKSTLADLLAGLLAPDRGLVAIDGVPLDPAHQRAWRGQVAYIAQEPLLLAASLRENLRWGAPNATDARLWAALEDAAAADFVRALPAGLDTLLGDGGRVLSGGERQRLMLAQALLRDPQMLILDEATSALDPANEAAIAAALGRLRGRMTILLIAHRGVLLGRADRIIHLDRGRVVDES